MEQQTIQNPNRFFISARDIQKMYNIPEAYIRKKALAGTFPAPLRMGEKRCRLFWKLSDVQAFFDNWSTNNEVNDS